MKELVKLAQIMQFPLKKYIIRYLWCIICAMAYTSCALVFPSIVGLVIDNGVVESSFLMILQYALLLLILGFLMVLFQYLQKIGFTKLLQDIKISIQIRLVEKITKTNYNFWKKHKAGDIYTVIEKDINQLENLLSMAMSDVIISIFVVIGVALYLIIIDKIIGIIIIFLALIFASAQKYAGKRAKREMIKLRNFMGKLSTLTNNIVNNILSIKTMGITKPILINYSEEVKNYNKQYIKQIKVVNTVQSTGMIFNTLGLFIIMLLGSKRVIHNELSVGVLFSLTIYLQRLYNPLVSIGNLYVSLKSITPIINRILDILENHDEVVNGTYIPKISLNGSIIIKDVCFKYSDSSENVFNLLNLEIRSGETIGIIGKNGSGKTSIIRLLARLCTPISGQILLDGISIDVYEENYLNSQIGIMAQEIYLPEWKLLDIFDGDLENISKIQELMEYLNYSIEKLPNGFDSIIGENKTSLSGGEIQKIAFIRLLLHEKQIYIMDEPTSALDINSEKKLIELIRTMLNNKTCIIITHREEILKVCDRVIKLS